MLQWFWNTRRLNLLAFGMSILGIVIAVVYFQNHLDLLPCPLCIFQRVALIAGAIISLIAALHGPGQLGYRIYAIAGLIASGFGIFIAARHIWIQNLPPELVPTCGPDLGYMMQAFPFFEMVQTVLNGSGECAEIQWSFLGLTIPGWVLVIFIIYTLFFLLQLWKGDFGKNLRPASWK